MATLSPLKTQRYRLPSCRHATLFAFLMFLFLVNSLYVGLRTRRISQDAEKSSFQEASLHVATRELARKSKDLKALEEALRAKEKALELEQKKWETHQKVLDRTINERMEEFSRLLRGKDEVVKAPGRRENHSTSKRQGTTREQAEEDHVSGCVMIMDSNHELIEWLAYHYHTLPLRRLIVFNDAKARTAPDPILQRWKGLINITVWNETQVFQKGIAPKQGNYKNYVWSQRLFNSRCMTTLYEEGQRWVQLFDPDEYLTINDRVYNRSDPMYGLNVASETIDVPTPKEAGSTLKLIKRAISYVQKFGTQGNIFLEPFETPCIALHRKQFGNLEEKRDVLVEQTTNGDPPFPFPFPFDKHNDMVKPSDLSTWRWRYWGNGNNIIGKALLDFDRIRKDEISSEPSVHRPIWNLDICRRELAWRDESKMVMLMNHYASSWEQILFRLSDIRGGTQGRIERYKNDQKFCKNHDDNPHILEWLAGFVESVGKTEAMRVLQHAGNPQTANIGAYLDPEASGKQ